MTRRGSRQAGADETILYTQLEFDVEVKRLTEGRGVDVVYDSVGKTTFDKSLNSLRPRERWRCSGNPASPCRRSTREF